MKKTIVTLMSLLLIVFFYSGCNQSDTDIVSPDSKTLGKMEVPFTGRADGFTSNGTASCSTGWTPRTANGEGNATYLGNMSFELNHCLIVTSTSGGLLNNGSGIMKAANGDEIWSTYTGTFTFNTYPPTLVSMTLNSTITGGTGRFANATGSFIAVGEQKMTVYPNPVTASWNGTITF